MRDEVAILLILCIAAITVVMVLALCETTW